MNVMTRFSSRDSRTSTEDASGRLPSVICPFCDCRIRAGERLVKCRNCGEVFESELELSEDEAEPAPDFF